jgi:hypothetical protein
MSSEGGEIGPLGFATFLGAVLLIVVIANVVLSVVQNTKLFDLSQYSNIFNSASIAVYTVVAMLFLGAALLTWKVIRGYEQQ